MGVSERRERDREEMRGMILDEARRLFLSKGFEKTSIRNIADAIEYSPATIYLYYRNKNEIFLALHEDAFLKMRTDFGIILTVEDPFERLIALGYRYINWADQNPELYDLCFIMEAPMEALACTNQDWEDGTRSIDLLKSIIAECIKKGDFHAHHDIDTLALTVWSYVHGLASIYLKKRMNVFQDDNNMERMLKSYELFIQMLRKSL